MDRSELIDKLKTKFNIKELVCPHCYNKFGEQSWIFLSTELLSTLYTLRFVILNCPILVNGGMLTQRGLRCNTCDLVKNKKSIYLSAHCQGKAIDFSCDNLSINSIKKLIRDNKDKFEYPIRLESNTTTWIHVDVYQPLNSNSKLVEFNG